MEWCPLFTNEHDISGIAKRHKLQSCKYEKNRNFCLLLYGGTSHNMLCLQLGDDVEDPVEEEIIEEVAPTELIEAPDLLSFDDEEETTVVRAPLVDAQLQIAYNSSFSPWLSVRGKTES